MDEFKRFNIPVKWRKYIWVGVIGSLVFALKWLASKTSKLEQDLKDCNKEKVMLMNNQIQMMDDRRRADSMFLERFVKKALHEADQTIIQPRLDSIKADKL